MTAKKDTENTVGSNAVIVESTALFALLESRHETMLQWCEPWPACGPEGNDLDAHIILRATVHDCINLQRRAAKAAGRPTTGDDGNHLLDFMAIHWARVVEANMKITGNPKEIVKDQASDESRLPASACSACGGTGLLIGGENKGHNIKSLVTNAMERESNHELR